MQRPPFLTSVLAACLCAGVAAASQDVPPPGNSEEAILKWARDSKLSDDTANPPGSWNMVGALDEGLLFASVQPPTNGIAKVGIRLERFKPAGNVRSEANMYDLDCGKQQIKATYDATFPEHNFGGARTDRPLNAAWTPVAANEIVAAVKDDACKAGPVTAAAPINIRDPAAIRQWAAKSGVLERNVGSIDQWSLLNASPEGLIYSALGRTDTQTRSAVLVVRLERFEPLPNEKIATVLSEATEYEISCSNNRIRKVSNTSYAGRNLQGRSDGARKLDPWSPVAQHPLLAKPGADLCRELQVRRQFEGVGERSRNNPD